MELGKQSQNCEIWTQNSEKEKPELWEFLNIYGIG